MARASAAGRGRRARAAPPAADPLSAFLGRRDPQNLGDEVEPFTDRAGGWLDLVAQAADLHPITRTCMGFHLWSLAGLGRQLRSRIATSEERGNPCASGHGRGRGLRAGGPAADRLARWLEGMKTACLTAMRHLDDIEAWSAQAETEVTPLSGRTPPALRVVLTEWPLVSAPMAEALTGASRAAISATLPGWKPVV